MGLCVRDCGVGRVGAIVGLCKGGLWGYVGGDYGVV